MANDKVDYARFYLELPREGRVQELREHFGSMAARTMRWAFGELAATWEVRRQRLPKPLLVNHSFHDTGSHLTFLLTAQGLPSVEVLYLPAWNGDYGHNYRDRRRGLNPEVPFAHQPVLDWIEQTFKDCLAVVEAREAAKRAEEERRAQAYRDAVNEYAAMMRGGAS